jgi:NitT/TauT family transport system permease protein
LFGFSVPWIGVIPAPSKVFVAWTLIARDPSYWSSWLQSTFRVFTGFSAAFLIGVPLGLSFARRPTVRGIWFPVFEILRPIPPIAWVPIAILFWPTQEMSIAFVIFLGAFYTMTLSAMNGAMEIDPAVVQSALSMGTSRWALFHRVIWPATLPSITTGAAVAMGITWEVVVAAEMISGSQGGGASGGGLGRLMWHSYVTGDYTGIVVAMMSIGIAGYLSSAVVRSIGHYLTPWRVK